jgi:prolipoprotein diacylglyceryltransferase
MAYAVLRSIVEIFRGDYAVYFVGGQLTPAQLLSIGIFGVGSFLYFWLGRRQAMAA